MLLSDDDRLEITLGTILEHNEDLNDVPMIIIDRVCKQIIKSVNKQIDTQEIYDEIIECFNYYNDFVIEKNIVELPIVDEGFYELCEVFLNDAIKEVFKNV